MRHRNHVCESSLQSRDICWVSGIIKSVAFSHSGDSEVLFSKYPIRWPIFTRVHLLFHVYLFPESLLRASFQPNWAMGFPTEILRADAPHCPVKQSLGHIFPPIVVGW